MGLPAGFSNHVFLSYSWRDNVGPDGAEGEGWVTAFRAALYRRLGELLGERVLIWRDVRMGASRDFNQEILDQIAVSAVFVAVLSPGWVKSRYCPTELEEFRRIAGRKLGLNPSGFLRTIPAIKMPLQNEAQRQVIPESLGREFFRRDPQSGDFEEYSPGSLEFLRQIDHLAKDIVKVLDALPEAEAKTLTSRPAVFVAEATSDLKEARQKLLDELTDRGYRILPAAPLPDDCVGLRRAVEADLREATLSVHLLGPLYGKPLKGSDLSMTELQLEAARAGGRTRIIWIDDIVAQGAQPAQEALLKRLRDGVTPGLDLLERKTIGDLKDLVIDRLTKPAPPLVASNGSGEDFPYVYLVCDEADHPANCGNAEVSDALAVRDFLFDAGFEVLLPAAQATAAASRRKDNKEKLKRCDAVLLYWGRAPDSWVEERLGELEAALGWRQSRSFTAKAIYAGPPPDDTKRIFRTKRARYFLCIDDFSPTALQSFVTEVRGGA
jgi:hypothetical protein